jgi:hypothetical protein
MIVMLKLEKYKYNWIDEIELYFYFQILNCFIFWSHNFQ